jgi:hypothetical protein
MEPVTSKLKPGAIEPETFKAKAWGNGACHFKAKAGAMEP